MQFECIFNSHKLCYARHTKVTKPTEGRKIRGGFCSNEAGIISHSLMKHYFFSYLLTWELDLIEILEIMAQMWQNVIFLSLKPTKVTSDFDLN